MSARESDLLRIQGIYDVVTQTLFQLEELGFVSSRFGVISNPAKEWAPPEVGSCRGGGGLLDSRLSNPLSVTAKNHEDMRLVEYRFLGQLVCMGRTVKRASAAKLYVLRNDFG